MDLELRIQYLERRCRLLSVACLLPVVLVVVMAAQENQRQGDFTKVTTQSLHVVDELGRERFAILAKDKDLDGALVINDDQGQRLVQLGISKGMSLLRMADPATGASVVATSGGEIPASRRERARIQPAYIAVTDADGRTEYLPNRITIRPAQ